MNKKKHSINFSTQDSDFTVGVDMGLDVMNLMMKYMQMKTIENEPVVSIGVLTAIFGCLYDMTDDADIPKSVTQEPVDKLIEIAQMLAKESQTVGSVTVN